MEHTTPISDKLEREIQVWTRDVPKRVWDQMYEFERDLATLKAKQEELVAGLERIANPIPYEQANVPEGYSLDGHALLAQVSKPLYYQTVARDLLAKHGANGATDAVSARSASEANDLVGALSSIVSAWETGTPFQNEIGKARALIAKHKGAEHG